jgi:nifR3 family TIM-barrel protein
MVVSELVSANGLKYASQRTHDLLKFHPEEKPVGLQIFGEDTENLVEACRVVEKLGADFVDLNLGCPVPKVVKKGAGAAMCRNPAELGKVLSAMVSAVKIPVTIKIRTGWDSESRNAHDVVQAAADAGVAWVAIHGRTRAQGYSGLADWEFIGQVKARARIPIIGNGDLNTAAIAVERYKTYGVDAVLIGRAALRNPFIFEQASALLGNPLAVASAPTVERYLGLLETQRELLLETFSPPVAMIHARKFLSWYSAGFPGCHEFRKAVFACKDPDELWTLGIQFFKKAMSGRDLSFMNEPFLMGGHG